MKLKIYYYRTLYISPGIAYFDNGTFIEITEMIIYFSLNLYSCALVSLLFWVPIDIVSFFRWNKNKDQENEDDELAYW